MAKSARTPGIEQCFTAIEGSVAALEQGELPLDEALRRYEAGLAAIRQARALLDGYAARIEELRHDAPAVGDEAGP